MGEILLKTCTKCKKTKQATVANFGRCGSNKDGLTGDCKPCRTKAGLYYKNKRNKKNRELKYKSNPDLSFNWMNGNDGVYCL